MQLTFNKMQLEDLVQVSEVEAANFSRPWKLSDFQLAYENPYAIYIVAKIDGKVIGICGLHHVLGDGTITNVAVLLEYRNVGIAYRMIEELIKVSKLETVTAFTLEVRESNQAAIKVYEKIGFQVEGIGKLYYDNPSENALIMWKR